MVEDAEKEDRARAEAVDATLAFMAKRIRELRRARRWTQDDLGVAAGLSTVSVGAIEAGRTHPQLRTLVKIAVALGTTPAAFFPAVPVVGEERRQDLLRALNDILFLMADEDDLSRLLAQVQGLFRVGGPKGA